MTTYDVLGIVRTALPNAITLRNIMSGFQVRGVYPFNRDIFSESDVDFSTADCNISKQTNVYKSTAFPSILKKENFPD